MKAVARVGDQITGTCRAGGHTERTYTGVWTEGSGVCLADGLAVIRVGDRGLTDCGHVIRAQTGSSLGTADGLALHRVDDLVYVEGGGDGHTVTGSSAVFSE